MYNINGLINTKADVSPLDVNVSKISLGNVNTGLYVSGKKITTNSSIKEEKDHYEIKIEVHGVEDIQISYERLTGLIVKGSKETLDGRKDVENTFSINEKIYNIEQISASIHKGILTISICKREEYKEKVLFNIKNEEAVVKLNDDISKIQHRDKEIHLEVNQKDINKTIDSIKQGGRNISYNSVNSKCYW
ncbi:MAG: Hsp20/alpha crystallin family protein [Bacilli bacterium]